MSFINVGQHDATTKAALKRAVAEDPSKVQLYSTSELGNRFEGRTAADCPQGVSLSVVGPDPYRDRRWYATIEWKAGKLIVR